MMHYAVGRILRIMYVAASTLIGKAIVVDLGGTRSQMHEAVYAKARQCIRVECGQRLERAIRLERQMAKIMLSQFLTYVLGTWTAGIVQEADRCQSLKVVIKGAEQGGTLQNG